MNSTLICFASWEPRFLEGVAEQIENHSIDNCIVLYATEFEDRTVESRSSVKAIAQKRSVLLEEVPVSIGTSIGCWISLVQGVPRNLQNGSKITFDISTTPREALWYTLHIINALGFDTHWIYYRPKSYAIDWLSRNALSPRLLLKRSGISLPGRKTCIVALAGYDPERLAQLIERYEPTKCFIGRQTGTQLDNFTRNTGFDNAFIRQKEVDIFDFDCYTTSDDAAERLSRHLPSEIWDEFNVIGASLGPKPSAITMFQLAQRHAELGLVYVPSGEYNAEYSDGIDFYNISQGIVLS